MSTSSPTSPPSSNSGATFAVNTTQYAVKKRRRPKNKKNKDAEQENAKSNPSKRHRDRLNKELDELAQLIPLPQDVLEKLDKLSILRLVVSYLRNKSYHSVESSNNFDNELNQILGFQPETQVACLQKSESNLALQALHGFLVVITQDFNIFYVTESVQEYLGFPQCDMMNLSMLDFVHVDDRDIFMRQMRVNQKDKPGPLPEEGQATIPEYVHMGMTPEEFKAFSQDGFLHRSFICRLRCLPDTSSGFLALHFTGHLRLVSGQNKTNEEKVQLPPEMGLFLLAAPLQSPSILEIRTKNFIFRTKHKLDYTPLGIDAKGKIVLGYSELQMRQRSGYEFIHSADMMHCADAHTKLMRLGESGFTVFRLLHKENYWVWVTASSRLVFKNGQPDCIIATQRPIQDQEGEEHMKKRSNAFRFDFTGHAILYGEVNPIGTRGGPENNPLIENIEEPPSSKRKRIMDATEVDRQTLYGAQAMQKMDIYVGNLPNNQADIFGGREVHASAGVVQSLIKNEQIGDSMGPLLNESNATFFPMGTDVSEAEHQKIMKQRFRNPNNMDILLPFEQNFSQASLSRKISDGNDTMSNPHQYLRSNDPMVMHSSINNEPLSTTNDAQIQQQSHLKRPYSSIFNSETMQHPNMQSQNEPPAKSNQHLNSAAQNQNTQGQTAYPSKFHQSATAYQCERMENMGFSSTRKQTSNTQTQQNLILQKQMQLQQYQQSMQQEAQQSQQHPASTIYNQSSNPVQMNQNPHPQTNLPYRTPASSGQAAKTAYQTYQDDLNELTAPIQHFNNPNTGQPPSVIDAMTINSVLTVQNEQGMSNVQLAQGANANMQLSVPTQFDVPELIASQNNTIRFDLDKVAAAYQTTDPLSKIEEYMHDNPAHAMAIATGLVPEVGMPNLATKNIKGFVPSGLYQRPASFQQSNQFPARSNVDNQFTNYSPSMRSDCNSDLFLSSMGSVGEESFQIPSVCSASSMSTSSLQRNSPMDRMMPEQYQGYQPT